MMQYSAPPVSLPSTKPEVPPGWRCEWSDQHQKFFYVHASTGDSSWNPPIAPPQHLQRKPVAPAVSYHPIYQSAPQHPVLYQPNPQQPVIHQPSPQTIQYFAPPPPPPVQYQYDPPPGQTNSSIQGFPQQQFSPPPQSQPQAQNRQSVPQFLTPPSQYHPQATPNGLRPGQPGIPQQRINMSGKPGQIPQKTKPPKSALKKWGKRAAIGLGGIAAVGAVAVGIDVADGGLFDGSWFDGLSGGDASGLEGLGGDGGSEFEDTGSGWDTGGYENAGGDSMADSLAQLMMEQQGQENALQLLDPVGTTYVDVPVTGTPADLI